jgi:CheY-like chemotaxis protein
MDSNRVKSLLAIDDNADAAGLIVRIANKCGFSGRALSDTRDVRKLLKEWQPDVLTLDLCMPEEDGFQIIAILEEVQFRGHLVVISGKDEWLRKAACDLAELRGIKIATHLQKPINVQSFRDVLTTLQTDL